MGNILNNNFHHLRLAINEDEYWDFHLNKDRYGSYDFGDGTNLYDKCLISYIDLTNSKCIVDDQWIQSTDTYKWESGVSIGYTLYNVGYTGVDNGLIRFRKDRISNTEFSKIYSESDFSFDEEDYRLKLHEVSGNTMKYEYPMKYLEESGCTKLNGGFYQGVFETECDKYAILPSVLGFGEEWDFEFEINKTEFEKESEKTLNDAHQENKGIFFYLGLRAENKWVYLYDKQYTSAETEMNTDDVVDYQGMTCDPNSKFTDVDWYDDLEEWRIEEEKEKRRRDREEYALDYIDYIYYPQELYLEDYTDDDYFDFDEPQKPLVITDKSLAKELEECCTDRYYCGTHKEKTFVVTTQYRCCGCGNCKKYSSITETIVDVQSCCSDKYLIDEYLEGVDDEFNWFGDTEYVEAEIDISAFEYHTAYYDLSLSSAKRYTRIYTDNKFLLFHRCGGYTTHNWVDGTVAEYYYQKNSYKGNLFLLMNRTCTGYTVHTIDQLRDESGTDYNPYEDLYNNALAFRITDNGAIGYRFLGVDCDLSGDNKTKIYEGYSFDNIIKENQWHTIHVKVRGAVTTMNLMFYVDGKLKYVTDDIPKINLRKLNEEMEKQELVPYNLSLGGGTQGLADVIMPNYMQTYDYEFPLEKYFGGTFIGYIRVFRWYNCKMEYMNIVNNFKYGKRYFTKKINIYN